METNSRTTLKSKRGTDPLALKIYRIMSRLPVEERALVHRSIRGSKVISSERVKVIEDALARFLAETGQTLSKLVLIRFEQHFGLPPK